MLSLPHLPAPISRVAHVTPLSIRSKHLYCKLMSTDWSWLLLLVLLNSWLAFLTCEKINWSLYSSQKEISLVQLPLKNSLFQRLLFKTSLHKSNPLPALFLPRFPITCDDYSIFDVTCLSFPMCDCCHFRKHVFLPRIHGAVRRRGQGDLFSFKYP